MSNIQQWIGICVALTIFLAAQGIYWLSRAKRRRRGELLRDHVRGNDDATDGIRIRRAARDQGRPLSRRMRTALEQGGITTPLDRFLFRTGAPILFASALVGAALASPELGVGLALTLAIGVYTYVMHRRDRRVAQLESQMAQALELMVFALRAGQSLEEAVRQASEEVDVPLSRELARCHQEYVMGRPIETSLLHLRSRWPSAAALFSFVEAVVVLKRTGGNLVDVLQTLIESVRAQQMFESKYRALTSEGRFSARVLIGLPFVAVALQALVFPGQLRLLLVDPAGRLLSALAIILWLTGVLWVTKLSRVGQLKY